MNKGIIKKVSFYFSIYIVCWVFSYVIVNGDLNIKYMVEYFKLAWSFNGFVRLTYTLILSTVTFLPVIGIIYFLSKNNSNAK